LYCKDGENGYQKDTELHAFRSLKYES